MRDRSNYRGTSLIDVDAKAGSRRDEINTRHNQSGTRTGFGCIDQMVHLRVY